MATMNGHSDCQVVNGHAATNGHHDYRGKKTLVDTINSGKKCVWNKKVEGTELEKFRKMVNKKYGLDLVDFWDLHKWSVDCYQDFWKEMWHYMDIKFSKLYEKVINPAECFSDSEWFPGARLNYAENMLRYRDDHTALIYLNEEGEEISVTFKEMYEHVRLYAAALRKHGLKEGDAVAGYISNRNEAVYAMLATASIGGLFGGPLPFYGAKAASNIIKMVQPKFVFAVDRFLDEGQEYNLLKNIPQMVNDMESVEKVIIIPSKSKNCQLDISGIKNSCLLEEFLESGRDKDGNVPELVFEQLPFNQPLFFGFTSGTTGLPKGIIHGAGNLLPLLRDYKLHSNFGRDDVVLSTLPLGWNLWNIYISNLALGLTMVLYDGCPYFQSKTYFWDLLSKYKITSTFTVTSIVDRMQKENIVPGPDCDLSNVKVLNIGGSPVKLQNFEYMRNILPEDAFVAAMYGSTEFLGSLGIFDINLPVYSGEIQAPTLGTHIMCFDESGKHVIGERGELVVAKPTPAMPTDFFVDTERIKSIYFGMYPGVWTQHDEVWFDPATKGFVVLGRSDETLNPGGERFGSSEIYTAIHTIEDLADYLCVGQSNANGDERAVLFVRLKKGYHFKEELVNKIKKKIETELISDCVPEVILEVKDIPYNLNKKRMEKLIKTIINTNEIPEVPNIRNPECLKYYHNIPELQGY